MQVGLLLIHVLVGALLAAHGAQKLFGAFGGVGLEGFGGMLTSLGLQPVRPLALAAGAAEFAGGGLLALGLATPLAALLIVSVMFVAARTAHAGKGLWASNGGWELPLVNAGVAVGLAFIGAGAWSLDAVIGWDVAGLAWGLGALLLGVLGGIGVLALGRARQSTRHTAAAGA
jgi:putative oxidoreductase